MIRNITVITSASGGTGKSTVTAGLACALALRGQKTIVLDLNPLIGGANLFLEPDFFSPYHLGDVAQGTCCFTDAVFPCCADSGLEQLFLTLPPQNPTQLPSDALVKEWLTRYCEPFDQVLLDLPWWNPCFSTVAALAKTTLLVTTTDPLSVTSCDKLRTSSMGQAMQNPRLVINRFHRQDFFKSGDFIDLDQVIDQCGIQLIAVVPKDAYLLHKIPETMKKTRDYKHLHFSQQWNGGAIALHCLSERLLGYPVPLRNLDWL